MGVLTAERSHGSSPQMAESRRYCRSMYVGCRHCQHQCDPFPCGCTSGMDHPQRPTVHILRHSKGVFTDGLCPFQQNGFLAAFALYPDQWPDQLFLIVIYFRCIYLSGFLHLNFYDHDHDSYFLSALYYYLKVSLAGDGFDLVSKSSPAPVFPCVCVFRVRQDSVRHLVLYSSGLGGLPLHLSCTHRGSSSFASGEREHQYSTFLRNVAGNLAGSSCLHCDFMIVRRTDQPF